MAKATFRLFQVVAVLMLMSSPAIAADKCTIVVPVGQGWDSEAIYRHELAHCNGWTHARYKKAVVANGYQGQVPPNRYVHDYAGKFEAQYLTPADTKKLCKSVTGNPAYGCQWFE